MATLKLPPGKQYKPREKTADKIGPLIRRGHASSSIQFDQFKRRNTPLGQAAKPAAWLIRKSWQPSNEEQAQRLLPKDVLLSHAVNICRKDLGLRPDRVTRTLFIDESRLKPRKVRKVTLADKIRIKLGWRK